MMVLSHNEEITFPYNGCEVRIRFHDSVQKININISGKNIAIAMVGDGMVSPNRKVIQEIAALLVERLEK